MWKKAEKRWKPYTATTYRIVLPASSILITLFIWKFVSQGKRESQPLGLLRISQNGRAKILRWQGEITKPLNQFEEEGK
jgi:hypothetical protein